MCAALCAVALACGTAEATPVAFARVEAGVDWTSAGVGGASGGGGTIQLTGISGTVTKAYLWASSTRRPRS